MLQPWFTGKKEQPELCSLMLHYKFHIGAIPQQLSLAMETPEHFTVLVNGRAALSETDDFWVDSCYTIFNIDPSSLKTGENTIAVSTKFRTDINLEAMYLLGSFGVSLEGRKAVLGQLPVKLKTGDITRQGFPFYGAGVTYFAEIPECPEGGAMVLGMKEMNTACIKVTDGEKEQMIACKPYEADITGFGKKLQIQYILTRRNTFGPLHQYPLIAGAYGPESFTSEGDGFLYDSYGLLPQGMTDPVTCTVYQKNRG